MLYNKQTVDKSMEADTLGIFKACSKEVVWWRIPIPTREPLSKGDSRTGLIALTSATIAICSLVMIYTFHLVILSI